MRCWRMRCWDIWRCWGPKIELKSYEEILALADEDLDEALTELNSHPKKYFDKFNSEWHMTQVEEGEYSLEGANIKYWADEIYRWRSR